MQLRAASRWLLGVAGFLLLAGGAVHTWAFSKATLMINASNLTARNGAIYKGLWLSDSGEVIFLGLAYLALAWQPRLGNRAMLALLAALPLASAVAIYCTVGNFVPGHLLLVSGSLAIVAGAISNTRT